MIIGIGATCELCGEKIRSGETYVSGFGDGNQSVHYVCNLRRLGLDQSHFGGEILSSLQSLAELMTSDQAAKELGVKPESIRKMVSKRQLTPIHKAGRNFFRPEDVEALKDRPRPGKPKKQA